MTTVPVEVPTMDLVRKTAKERNGWEILGFAFIMASHMDETSYGVILFKREQSPLGEGREFGTIEFRHDRNLNTCDFNMGHYDRTYWEARDDFFQRVKDAT